MTGSPPLPGQSSTCRLEISFSLENGTGRHGFVYNGGTFTTLDHPSANAFTVASGINASGQIVGITKTTTTSTNNVRYGFYLQRAFTIRRRLSSYVFVRKLHIIGHVMATISHAFQGWPVVPRISFMRRTMSATLSSSSRKRCPSLARSASAARLVATAYPSCRRSSSAPSLGPMMECG
jgi:hypothetical protein